ncbi:MAG: DUF4296 domain-containing protein [Crocinitomicaceae bacterium]|nr:DUF4296 domain-containing protein [Crocinitomicaceae bacterium]
MKRLYFLILFVVTACSSNPMLGTKKPSDLISKDEMVQVLIDLNLIEADLQMKYSHISFYSDAMKKSGQLILKKYGFTPHQFEKSFDYYATRQEEMIVINNQILDSMNVLSAKTGNALKTPENTIQTEESELKKSLN